MDGIWMLKGKMFIRSLVVVVLLLLASMPGCLEDDGSEIPTISFYGFSVKGEAFDISIIPAFKASWKNETGVEVVFRNTYAFAPGITPYIGVQWER